ncbi:Protein IQ-DOMAIN 14 [Acorus calamus]|uniref:Protein IQ-DOMAIN 14 n=1 Tax=Acorus calamus TaxID=4465 RepID=A0AAV9F010_ACOCL|nr:Protein IQ-DOMAIN 14 [Acorus calamus]
MQSPERKIVKEKKRWGLRRLRHGEANSLIPLKSNPSSIEKILRDAEGDVKRPILPSQHVRKAQNTHIQLPPEKEEVQRPLVSLQQRIVPGRTTKYATPVIRDLFEFAATRIQAVYRGYMARKNYRAHKGLVKLQRLVRSQGVKDQTSNALRFTTMLVRIQSQIQSMRLQKVEMQSMERRRMPRTRETKAGFGKFSVTQPMYNGFLFEQYERDLQQEEWDDSVKRKMEGVIKRERAMAFAYSHQLSKGLRKLDPKTFNDSLDVATPRSSQSLRVTSTAAASKKKRVRRNNIRSRYGGGGGNDSPMSCPPPSATPNYMAQTASAKAKVIPMGSLKCNRGSSMNSVGGSSVDSTASLPALLLIGRGFK